MTTKRILSVLLVAAVLTLTCSVSAMAVQMAVVDTVNRNGTVHLRASARNGNNIIHVMSNGDLLQYLGRRGNWYRVKHLRSGLTGYIYKTYMTKLRDFNDMVSWGALAHIKTKYQGSTVHLRSGPGLGFSIRGYLTTGDTLAVLKKHGKWYHVQTWKTNRTGYVHGNYIANGGGGVTTVNVNLRKKASTSSQVLSVIPGGTSVTVLNIGARWSKVKYAGKTGYVWNGYLRIR